MSFKTFFVKNVLISYFISATCISIGVAVLGSIFQPDAQLNYNALIYPQIYAILSSLIMLVKYSKKELTTKQMLFRNILHFSLLEITILLFVYLGSVSADSLLLIAVAVTVFIIYISVYLISWINDLNTAKIFNAELKKMQAKH